MKIIEMKKCSSEECEKPIKPATQEFFYKYKVKNKKYDDRIMLSAECKECRKKRSLRDRHKDIELTRERDRKQYYNRRETELPRMKEDYHNRKEERRETLKKWIANNPEKLKEYQQAHRDHEISEDEWFACLDYFNWECAYCGYDYDEHIINEGQQLHKDHVFHDGNNFLDNCVPSCRSCNSSKHDSNFENWYNKDKPFYTKRRLNKIVKWMTKISLTV